MIVLLILLYLLGMIVAYLGMSSPYQTSFDRIAASIIWPIILFVDSVYEASSRTVARWDKVGAEKESAK